MSRSKTLAGLFLFLLIVLCSQSVRPCLTPKTSIRFVQTSVDNDCLLDLRQRQNKLEPDEVLFLDAPATAPSTDIMEPLELAEVESLRLQCTEIISATTDALYSIIENDDANDVKYRKFWDIIDTRVPGVRNEIWKIHERLITSNSPSRYVKSFISELNVAVRILDRFMELPRRNLPEDKAITSSQAGYTLQLSPEVVERYWMFYHFTEILGAYNDDQFYTHIFSESGRVSFLDEEIGTSGIEMLMDWWMVSTSIWRDEFLADEEKLMSVKYSMWQNIRWGGGEHYIDEYWAWEPSFKDEDCALFTGNFLSALAAEYSFTRHPRTLGRLRAMVNALMHFDRLKDDSENPLEIDVLDGRLQRGPKTKNYYPELDPTVFWLSWDADGLRTHHHTREPDRTTGRERANVSRDQYYGVLTGYYSLYKVLSGLDEPSEEEAGLLEDIVEHCRLIADYLDGPRIRLGYGPVFNLYSLFEGSCANPPNLSFMGSAAFVGLEEITGNCLFSQTFKYPLYKSILKIGMILNFLEFTQSLLEPTRTSFTTLNQVLAALLMSDLSSQHWEFYFAPEYVVDASEKERRMWRRVIGTYLFKFGTFGNSAYQNVLEDMLLPEENIPFTLEMFFNRYHGAYSVIEPQYKVEEFMWPLSMMIAASENCNQIGQEMVSHYQSLVEDGQISFAGTDLSY